MIASAMNTTSPFTWQPGNMYGPNVTVTPTKTTTYTVSASSGCGLAIATITINVNPLPATSFYSDNLTGCAPLCIQFRDRTTCPEPISQWVWSLGNGDTLQSQSPIYCYKKSGSYDVSLTTVSDSGCSSTLGVINYITVYTGPLAKFGLSPQPTSILAPTIQFTDSSTDSYGISEWSWNFGETGDTISNLQNPRHVYRDTGTYCPTLIVTNGHGCADTVTNCLVIDPLYELYIPSAFTPNSDGKNEVFIPKGNDVTSFEMYIFDRWGMQLFHSTDMKNGWNGTVKGGSTISAEDTYVYLIHVYDTKHKEHTYTGRVTLLK
jgi:gliding motility-associated-like protein